MAKLLLQKQLKVDEAAAWSPLAYQLELSKSQSKIRGIIGGNRTGKTEWGAKEVADTLKLQHPFKQLSAPQEVWIGTPSFDTQLETAQPKLLKFLGEDFVSKCQINYYAKGKIKDILTPFGTKCTFKSYEQDQAKWAGAEKNLIWFDEEPPHDIWVESLVRQGKDVELNIIFTLTPVNGMTWFYDDVWQQAQANGYDIKTPRWEDNIHLTQDQIKQMEMMLSPEELEVRRFGRFVRSVGLVCHWWRRDLHVQDLSSFDPRGSTIWVGIDFGFTTKPTAAVFLALKGDNLYIFDGIYERGLTTPMLVQRLREKLGSLYVTGWVGDSESPSDIAEMQKYGIPIKGVTKETGGKAGNWDEYRAKKMTEAGQINQFTGQPRLIVAKHLLSMQDGRMVNWFVKEVEGLFWKQVRSADGMQTRREWGDQNKDAIDALSYILTTIPQQVQEAVKYQSTFARKSQIPRETDLLSRYDI